MSEEIQNNQKQGTICPVCGTRKLKLGEKMVYCEGYKPRKDGDIWNNYGECNFHIGFNQKLFGRTLTPSEIRRLINGEILKNAKGDVLRFDPSNEDHYTRVEFAPKKEDRDF